MYLTQQNPESYWVIDIEADGLQPTKIWCAVCKNLKTQEVRTFTESEDFNAWLHNAEADKARILVGHNILSYDAYHLNRLWDTGIAYDRCVDTLVLSYLYNPALPNGHSLESYGVRLDFPKQVHTEWDRYSPEMLSRCKVDVDLTEKVYHALCKKMLKLGYSEQSCRIEHDIRTVIDEQQRHGFWFDRVRATDFRDDLRRIQSDLAVEIQTLFPASRTKVAEYRYRRTKDGSPVASYGTHVQKYDDLVHVERPDGEYYECYQLVPFNLGSPIQRVKRLLEIGWQPDKFTKTKSEDFPQGFPKVDEDALVLFAKESGHKAVQALAEWLVLQGRASMLDTWLNNLGDDSRIHGRITTCGATTRRMIHSTPNTANIPSGAKAKYGHECRSFWSVEPDQGLVLVGYDASGLETAGLCHYLNNPAATDVLLQSKPNDVHSVNSRRLTEALGWACDREWAAKTSWYAWLYGAYEPKLGSICGATKHGKADIWAGKIVVETFFKTIPGLKELINRIQNEFRSNNGRLVTIDGGTVLCPAVNAALNYRVQSLGAILMKLAAIILDQEGKKAGIKFHLVGSIHDEGQLECEAERAEELGKLAVWSIEEAGRQLKLNVPVTGDYKIGMSWDQTH